MTRQPLLGAIAVLIKEDQVLLARRKNDPDAGLWGFPGGHVDWGETALDAAARELSEETGVIAKPLEYLTNVDVIVANDTGQTHTHFLLAAVLCDYVSGTPQAADDVHDAAWVPIDRVLSGDLPMSAQVDDLVLLAQARLSGPS